MDELIIGEKKYISSKQAAKVTGYAKDYIGQLCREGRVSARLVGRSWYVLESALHDHRFGEPKEASVRSAQATPMKSVSGWESPRYVAANAEVLPSINRLETTNEEEEGGTSQRLQDTWQAWFDRFDSVVNTANAGRVGAGELVEEEEKGISVEQKEVSIPIHTIYREPQYQQLEESMPQSQIESLGGESNKLDKDQERNERIMAIKSL